MVEALHGGRVHAEARARGCPVAALIDFSANVNPLGPPESVWRAIQGIRASDLTAYPDEEAPELRKRLARLHGVDPQCVVLGRGGSDLLHLALRALAPRRVGLPIPCFREQPRALEAVGATMVSWPFWGGQWFPPTRETGLGSGDALLLTNPHNPTGRAVVGRKLADWAEAHPELAFVVDEAFADYAPRTRMPAEILQRPRTVRLQSLTKFHAIPGIRVGYALADRATADRMRELQPSWPLGQLELRVAEGLWDDPTYAERTRACFREDARSLRKALRALGLRPLPSAAPFFLVPVPIPGTHVAEALKPWGILLRTCADWPGLGDGYIRLAVRRPPDQAVLIEALARALQERSPKLSEDPKPSPHPWDRP